MIDYSANVIEHILENKLKYEDAIILHYQIKYPQFQSELFNDSLNKINDYYLNQAINAQNYCQIDFFRNAVQDYKKLIENGYPIPIYEYILEYNITYNKNCTISLYYDNYQYTGGAHGNTTRTSDTWNIEYAYKYNLASFFPQGYDYKSQMIYQIYSQIQAQRKKDAYLYFEDYIPLVVQTFNENNFYLDEQGMIIYFQQYDIAPYVQNIPIFTIAYAKNGPTQPNCNK